jgi:hypothetical protein
MTSSIRKVLVPAVLLLALAWTADGAAPPSTRDEANKLCEGRLRKDLCFLASKECEGRGPTTQGLERAAGYIADQFKAIGLKPGLEGSYFQTFRIAGVKTRFTLTGPRGQTIELKQGTDFNPLVNRKSCKVTAPIVFAGYGVVSKDPPYDDYAGLDVKGKIVVLLRDAPRVNMPDRPAGLSSQVFFQTKLAQAFEHGAAAVLLVALDGFDAGGGKRPPGLFIRRSVLESMLPADKNLDAIVKDIDRDLKPRSFALTGWTGKLEVERRSDLIPLRNVVGVLEGKGPLANETVVVAAHYDHLGYGGGASRADTTVPTLHPGADDNASGTAAIIELARRFARLPRPQPRRLVFIAFSGEELGMLGSEYYCANPIFPLEKTAAMFNLDMVGRLRIDPRTKKPRLLTQGHGTAKPFQELIEHLAKKYDFTLTSTASGFGTSDHNSFTGEKVPVLFFWTGLHPDYHTPSDTVDKINFAGMRTIVDMSQDAVTVLATMARPAFIEVTGRLSMRPSTGPRLGIRPKYDSKDGVEVEDVVAGGIAARAGIRKGDRIVQIADQETRTLAAYLMRLAAQKRGTTIEVIILRDREKKTLTIKLER